MTEETGVTPDGAVTDEDVSNASTDDTTDDQGAHAEQPATQDAEDREGDKADDEEPKGKSRNQRRKEALERSRTESAEWQAKYDEAQAKLDEIRQAAASSKVPTQAEFDTYEDYQAALSAHYAMQQLDGRETARIEREADAHKTELDRIKKQEQDAVAQGWRAQVEEAKTTRPDFEKVAFTAPLSEDLAQLIIGMDRGAEVAYQLGLDHAEARRISALPPVQAAMELGRMESRLATPEPRKSTQAPDPITPVKPKGAGMKDPEKMTMAEYAAARKAGKI